MVVRGAAGVEGSERRIITVLAVDVAGSTRHIAGADPEDAQAFFDGVFGHLRLAIERSGGRLVSYEGDGGIAAFGWPLAFEDHADRACTAGWDIQHGPGPTGPDGRAAQFRVGVHSGLAAVRRFRRGDRSRFNTVGATVHLAAKLQQAAAPGSVLVTSQAARLCRSQVRLTPCGAKLLLGETATEAFVLDARPERLNESAFAQRYGSPLVARREELALLRRSLPQAGARANAVALIGEAGIGKSRLAAAVVGEAQAAGTRVLIFFGDAYKRSTPFAAARAVMRELLDQQPLAVVLQDQDFDLAEAETLEAMLIGRRARDKGVKLTQTQLARALARLFTRLACDRPTMLLVEDLHLLDAESRQFLQLAAREAAEAPLLLLATGRPEAREDAQEIVEAVIPLEPLPHDAMALLARQLWPEDLPSGPALARIVDRADGVPFVLEELVRSVAGGDHAALQTLPPSVGSVIHARLQRLSPKAKALAQALSLLGEHVDLELVAAVMGARREDLHAAFAELERFAFVHPPAERTTHMRHQIIAEACAETIPREGRRELHRRAAYAIRALNPELDGHHEQLAFHAEGAGDLAAALNSLWAAALEARRSSAAASLNTIFDRAVDVAERLGEPAEQRYVDFVLMAFASLVQLGEFEKLNRHLPRVMAHVRASGRSELICSALSQLGMVCWFEGRYEEGVSATEEGLEIARSLGSPALIFSNTIMLTNILRDMGRVARATEEERRLCAMLTGDLATARLGAPGMPRATALAFLSWFVVDVGSYDEGLRIADEALALATREGDPYGEVLARNALGRTLTLLERYAEAAACFAAAREICDRDGYDAIKAHLAGRIATALARIGRADEAVQIVEDCLRGGLDRRTGQLEIFTLRVGYGEALARAGDIQRGLEEVSNAIALARRIHSPPMLIEALGVRARLAAESGPADRRAASDLREQAELCRTYGVVAWASRDVTASAAVGGP